MKEAHWPTEINNKNAIKYLQLDNILTVFFLILS